MDRRPDGLGAAFVIAASVVVVGVGISLAAPMLGWILLSVFFAILARPPYAWLQQRGLPTALALLAVALAMFGIAAGLVALVGVSLAGLVARAPTYQEHLADRLVSWRIGLDEVGLQLPTDVLLDLVSPGLIIGWIVTLLYAISSVSANFLYILVLVLFLLVDGPSMMARMRDGLGPSHPLVARLDHVGPQAVRMFGIRAKINLLTGAGIAAALWLLDIDYALLWGALVFFMTFVPYVGIVVASAPPVVLALAEQGVERAMLVVAGIAIVNLTLEYGVMPRLVGSSLNLRPTFVLVLFFFWIWLLGASGALLPAFLGALMVAVLDSYEPTRWLASAMMARSTEAQQVADPACDAIADAAVRA